MSTEFDLSSILIQADIEIKRILAIHPDSDCVRVALMNLFNAGVAWQLCQTQKDLEESKNSIKH